MFAGLALLIALVSTRGLLGGEKEIRLKDGTTKSVQISILGNPVHFKDKFVRVLDIHPAIETLYGAVPPIVCWQFKVEFPSGFYGTVLISSPYATDQARATLGPQNWNGNFFHDAGIEAFDRKSEPGLWEWLKGDEEAWIPFHFQVRGSDGKQLDDFDDWGHVSVADIQKARKDMAVMHQPELRSEQRSIDLPSGERLQATLLDGNPVHYRAKEFGITELAPAALPSKDHKAIIPLWILKGWINTTGKKRLTITCPWFSKSFTQSVDIGPNGRFVMVFAQEKDAPDLWRWLEDDGDTFFPWEVHVEALNQPEGTDMIEWARVTPDQKLVIRKQLKRE